MILNPVLKAAVKVLTLLIEDQSLKFRKKFIQLFFFLTDNKYSGQEEYIGSMNYAEDSFTFLSN